MAREHGVARRRHDAFGRSAGRLPARTSRPTSSRAIYQRWLDADVFAPDGAARRADQRQQPFVIIQPPPNVTGALHIGHALARPSRT